MGKLNKEEKSWVMYDWANSVYATIIMAAVFPIYFTSVCKALDMSGDILWGTATSISTLIVAVLCPVLGAIGDYKGRKKKLLAIFMGIGVITTLSMAIFDQPILMLVGYVISYVGFAVSNLFYDSLLTDVTTPERMDKVSSYGFAAGYIGGSTIPFILSILLIQFGPKFGVDGTLAVKLSVVLTSVWWGLFSIPVLKNAKQRHYIEQTDGNLLKEVFLSLGRTLKEMWRNRSLGLFIIAYFFYIDGVGTIIHMATAYGATLGLDSTGMILALLVTQIVAIPCSILFGNIASKKGSFNTLLAGICIYIVICILGFYMGYIVESAVPGETEQALSKATVIFWILAVLVGTVQGGMQAISRSTFGKMIPPEKSNEFFGFFDVFGKFATIMGPALYAAAAAVTGRSSIGILIIIVLFVIGGVILLFSKKAGVPSHSEK